MQNTGTREQDNPLFFLQNYEKIVLYPSAIIFSKLYTFCINWISIITKCPILYQIVGLKILSSIYIYIRSLDIKIENGFFKMTVWYKKVCFVMIYIRLIYNELKIIAEGYDTIFSVLHKKKVGFIWNNY